MHPNPIYRLPTAEVNIAFARDRGFGALAVNNDDGPLISHIPFVLSEDGNRLEAHLVRSNPIVRLLAEPVAAVMAVSGGDAYVSPDWYGMENQVPTWNYVAVHIRGTLEQRDPAELPVVLAALSAQSEDRLKPKTPWTMDKVDPELSAKLQRQIVPIVMTVSDIQGTWKLAQNKPVEAREGARAGIAAARLGGDVDALVEIMGAVKEA